jgi:hypothetical protein
MAQLNDSIKITGEVTIQHFDQMGSLLETRKVKNLVVTSGRAWVASRISSAGATAAGFLGVGTGATAAALGNTALETPLGARIASNGGIAAGAVVTFTTTIAAGIATGALTEAGLFDAISAGTMIARVTFGTLTKAVGDTVVISWAITAA